jgi:predicted  nucleic acid-binding Zn-ribbon protein
VKIAHEDIKQSIRFLLKLQEIDGKLFKLKEEIERPASDFLELKKLHQDLKDSVQVSERKFRQVDRERRALELKFLTLQEDLRKAESRRKEVRNTKEEFASDREVDNLQKRLQETKALLDERAAASDERLKSLEARQAELSKVDTELQQKTQDRNEKIESLAKDLKTLEDNRKDFIAKVHEDIFSMYERVQKLRRGTGVAVVSGRVCGGCFVSLPPQMVSQLQRLEDLHTCPSCSRILFPEALMDDVEVDAGVKAVL